MKAGRIIQFVAGVTSAAAVVTAAYFAGHATPVALNAPTVPTTAPAEQETFADERTAAVHFERANASAIRPGAGGTITHFDCVPGTALASGSVALRVDERPLLTLHTDIPLYRDLTPGLRGRDVESLQHELTALGFAVEADGTYGGLTERAVRALEKSVDLPSPDGSLALAEVVWTQSRTVPIKSCDARVGDHVDAGGVIATPAPSLVAVQIEPLGVAATPGERRFSLWGISATLPDGAMTLRDADALAQIAKAPEYLSLVDSKDVEAPKASLLLTAPITVLKVPPSAVFGISAGRACIRSDGKTVPVTVVGSGLGASLVRVESTPPARVDIGPAVAGMTCEGTT